eukprot:TRINITY_DN12433_c0_g1_i1.p1 TRINITY_DN12433_c0_g1~~TRINITY_DN12433_c0_g1_i1.p1  ORF type:complete len:142 (-),score=28.94 TRINITY_DN12433_c0_g1_i1:49-474(-)
MDQNADNYVNHSDVERAWLMKAVKHAEIYERLIKRVDDLQTFNLTPIDDDIYNHFKTLFPNFRLDQIQENELKSAKNKTRWRNFIESYEDKINDFNFGTLIRLDSSLPFGEENSTLVVRTQFYAIEIARNREGFNDVYAQS